MSDNMGIAKRTSSDGRSCQEAGHKRYMSHNCNCKAFCLPTEMETPASR